MKNMDIKRPFVIVNMGLFVLVVIIFIYPAISSWINARRLITQQQQVYAVYAMQTEFFYDNGEIITQGDILAYHDIVAAIADIYSLAHQYELEIINFNTSNSTDLGGIAEIRGSAAFVGTRDNIAIFVYKIAETATVIRTINIDFSDDGTAVLRVDFILFASMHH